MADISIVAQSPGIDKLGADISINEILRRKFIRTKLRSLKQEPMVRLQLAFGSAES